MKYEAIEFDKGPTFAWAAASTSVEETADAGIRALAAAVISAAIVDLLAVRGNTKNTPNIAQKHSARRFFFGDPALLLWAYAAGIDVGTLRESVRAAQTDPVKRKHMLKQARASRRSSYIDK